MSNNGREEMLKIAPVIITAAPMLVLRLLISYLKFRGNADRASKEVRNGMIQEGMPIQMAASLAREFNGETQLWRLMTHFGPPR